MVPGHCFCLPPRHTGNAGFMVGILMVGLKRYYEATGERRVKDAIVAAADYVIDATWVPETGGFRYTSCPHSGSGRGGGSHIGSAILKGVAAAYQFSGKERFRDLLLTCARSAAQATRAGRVPKASRGGGKGISSPMRSAPQVIVGLPEQTEVSP